MEICSLVQFCTPKGERAVAAVHPDGRALSIVSASTVYELAFRAIGQRMGIKDLIGSLGLGEVVDLRLAAAERRLLSPIDHPDPAHLYVTGTGLTHLGSAESRDSMHRAVTKSADQTDSMRMFLMGVNGGKPANNQTGIQPEWFYKGNGETVVGPEMPLVSPSFAMDGGEEPEIAGIYVIDSNGIPVRVGYCLANEFSDHAMEKINYLWLSHSKLRPIALGPEILIEELPHTIKGTSRILRGGLPVWERSFVSGESNMSHFLKNLEWHHFKYALFRRSGDVHVHCFGTATLSFTDSFQTRPGDIFEIVAEPFHLPLRNTLANSTVTNINVRVL